MGGRSPHNKNYVNAVEFFTKRYLSFFDFVSDVTNSGCQKEKIR